MTLEQTTSYKEQMTLFIAEAIDREVQKYWYDNIQDVSAYLIPGSRWYSEAVSILIWNSSIWENLQSYFDTMTDETIIGTDRYMEFIPELKNI